MNDERWNRVRGLFDRAREMAEGERGPFLDRELEGEPELRAEIDALLAHAGARDFLVTGDESGPRDSGVSPPEGSLIGPYRIIGLLGEGGFGIVCLAEQLRPIRRRIALKLIKPGMDTKQVIARFETERQALALMDHPGIAQVFDAGETEAGRPYFAMEYVPGVPITTFCDQERLRIRERLGLFLTVCDAVQHAHQNGVIHRDIKPTNVLVARRDGVPTPKVIDFGIAKATGAAMEGRGFVTREGAVLGTLGYMSPEQTGAIPAPVDTRSDIYSLGVLLYELLTGETPFDRERLEEAGWAETMRVLREEDPPGPTARLARLGPGASTSGASDAATGTATGRAVVAGAVAAGAAERLDETAGRRSVDARTLLRELKGELEWIALRALERDPGRRYASASELSADIRRHLANEPVLARAPSTIYRVRKFARRHRVGVAAAALVLAAVVAGGIAAGIGFRRAVLAERVSRREADSARRVADFLVELFQTADPNRSRGETITARTLLEQGTRRIRASADQDPRISARLLTTLGEAHQSLGLYDEGLSLLRDALATSESFEPRDEMAIAAQLRALARGLRTKGKTEEVEALLDRAIAIAQETERGSPGFLAACFSQKAEWLVAQGLLEPADSLIALALRMAGSEARPDTLQLIRIYVTTGQIAHRRFLLENAEHDYLRALHLTEKVGSDPSASATIHSHLAYVYGALHQPAKAVEHAEESVRIARRLYPPDHPGLATALGGQALAFSSQGDHAGAAAVLEEAASILRRNAGREDMLAGALNTLGQQYRGLKRLDLAIERTEEACALDRKVYGSESPRTAEKLANLARYYSEAGRLARADSTYREALPIFEQLDQETIHAAYALMGYGDLCRSLGRLDEADTVYTRAEAMMDTAQAGVRIYVVECLVNHAYTVALQGRHARAESLMQAWFAIACRDSQELSEDWVSAYVMWAAARARAGDADGAIAALRMALRAGPLTADGVASYGELAFLRSRSDYPPELRE